MRCIPSQRKPTKISCASRCMCAFFTFFFVWWKVLWAIIKLVFAVVGSNVSRRAALLTKRVLPGFYCVCYAVLRLIVGSISTGIRRWTETRHDKPRTVELRVVAEERERERDVTVHSFPNRNMAHNERNKYFVANSQTDWVTLCLRIRKIRGSNWDYLSSPKFRCFLVAR